MSLGPEPDLAWTATQYALGDLSTAECLVFESLMADDQLARDALADAVDLLGAIAIVSDEMPLAMPVRRRRLNAWAALAAAACVLAVAVGLIWNRRTDSTDATDVAQAWSDLRANSDAEWSPLVEAHHPSTGPESGSADAESSTDRPLPSWLLTAASVPQAGPVVEEN